MIVRPRRFEPYRGTVRARRYYSGDPFLYWLYRDPRRAAALSVMFTVGSILVWLLMVIAVLTYLAIKVF